MRIGKFLLRKVTEAERIPRGYGFAWSELDWKSAIYFPIPFNLVLRFIRWSYFATIWAAYPLGWERVISSTFAKGRGEMTTFYQEVVEKRKQIINQKIRDFEADGSIISVEVAVPLLRWARDVEATECGESEEIV